MKCRSVKVDFQFRRFVSIYSSTCSVQSWRGQEAFRLLVRFGDFSFIAAYRVSLEVDIPPAQMVVYIV